MLGGVGIPLGIPFIVEGSSQRNLVSSFHTGVIVFSVPFCGASWRSKFQFRLPNLVGVRIPDSVPLAKPTLPGIAPDCFIKGMGWDLIAIG